MISALDLLFYLGIGWLATHELDAIKHHEWRIFFFLKPFDDQTAYRIFVALYIPLFAAILYAAPSRPFQIAFDLFLMVHVGLHIAFRNLPSYEFDNGFSNFLILGAGVVGALHLGLLLIA
jgi:hypothetical protein